MNRKQRRAGGTAPGGTRSAAGTRPDAIGRAVAALFAEAVALHQSGRLAEAEDLYRSILRRQPELPAVHYNLADLLLARHRIADAIAAYRRAIAGDPAFSAAHNGLGFALQAQGDRDGAKAAYHSAVASDPGNAEALCNLGRLLAEDGRLDEAVAAYDAALRAKPELVEARYNLGRALAEQGDFAAAAAHYRAVLARRPEHAEARFSLALTLRRQGETAQAEAALRALLRRQPGHADAELELAWVLLERGDAAGWRCYEARFRLAHERGLDRALPVPRWQGEPLGGRRLLVWREQGVGDELLFAAWYPDVIAAAAAGGHCVIEAERRLVALFRRSFPAAAVVPEDRAADATRGDVDCHIPASSLPRHFGPRPDRLRRGQAYLRVDPDRRQAWAEHFRSLGSGPKVGICWRSGRITAGRQLHYADLDQWRAVLEIPGVTLVNLQYDDCAAELARAESLTGVRIHRCPGIDLRDDLDGAAALTAALDLVISAPTATVAMAFATGVETWLLRHGAGTRGQPPEEDLGPVPGRTVWSRHWQEPWSAVLERVAAALRQRL